MSRPKRVLIVADAADMHAAAVAYALRRKGHCCERLVTPDFPTLLSLSLDIDPTDHAGRVVMHGPGLPRFEQSAPFDAVWLRRLRGAVLPEAMHAGDKEIASRQCECFLAGLMASLQREGPVPFWVNSLASEATAPQKPYQLRKAVRAGLEIPETLISNDPAEIRPFIRAHGGTVAHKLLEPASWFSHEGGRPHIYAAYTVPVTEDQLPEDAVLRLCPGIFQPFLKKSFEVRVACLGDLLAAARIDSQADPRAATDWRAGQIHVEMQPYELPHEVAEGCRRLLRELDIVHASLDFVVGPEGEHIFLEANPQGQFLFLETRAGMPLLDMFSEFLVAGRRDFVWSGGSEAVRFADFEQEWEERGRADAPRHVRFRKPVGVPDVG